MKKLIYYILPILSVMFVPTSCMDKHDAPVINDNDGSGIIASSTIKELKDKYKSVMKAETSTNSCSFRTRQEVYVSLLTVTT